jgi:hypothetical protein
MIERDLQEWEEYDARIFNDGPSSLRATANAQSRVGYASAPLQETEVVEGPFLVNNSGEIAAEMESLETYPSRPAQTFTQGQSQEQHPAIFERDTPPAPSPYDRDAAADYAKKFAFSTCSDGFMMLTDSVRVTWRGMPVVKMPADAQVITDGPGEEHVENADGSPFKLSNGVALTQKEMDDCTHFISCCIGRPPNGTGGGIKVPINMWGTPPDNPYGITRVSTMIAFLVNSKLVQVVASKTKDEAEINKLEKGDIIAYAHPTAGFTHLGLYLGGGKISSHTISRFDRPWNLGKDQDFNWTMLHFV